MYVPACQRDVRHDRGLVQGDTDVARDRLRTTSAIWPDAARVAGDTIVSYRADRRVILPTRCALGFPDDPDVQLVASKTVELTAIYL